MMEMVKGRCRLRLSGKDCDAIAHREVLVVED